jgi:peptidoglycan/LPS O-acetylase OafA/YrhL
VRVPLLDAFRASAILLVIVSHVSLLTPTPFAGGIFGVDLSFFLSGFCLMLVYMEHKYAGQPFQSWDLYASRRFWKIVPSYYLALLPIALVFPFEARAGITRVNDVLLHVSFLYPFNAASYFSLNGNYWSLGVEVLFYLIFPLFVLVFLRRPWIATGALALAGLLYITIITHAGLTADVWFFGMPGYLPLFAFGACASYVYARWIRTSESPPAFRAVMAAASIVAFGAFVVEMVRIQHESMALAAWIWDLHHRFELSAIFAVLALSLLAAVPRGHSAIANPVVRFIAAISYNMYLWNAPVIALLALSWHAAPFVPLLAVTLALVTGIAFLIHRFFERPLMRFGARLARGGDLHSAAARNA